MALSSYASDRSRDASSNREAALEPGVIGVGHELPGERELAAAVADKETMLAQNLELEAAAEVASAAIVEAKADQDAAVARVEAAERRRADARGETEGLEKELAGKKAKIDSLEAEVKELRAKETDAVKECGSLRAEIARLEAGSAARTRADRTQAAASARSPRPSASIGMKTRRTRYRRSRLARAHIAVSPAAR